MALLVTGISTIFALVTNGVEQEVTAESAQHDLVELLLNEFVAVHLVHFSLALSDSSLSSEAAEWCIERAFSDILLDCVMVRWETEERCQTY